MAELPHGTKVYTGEAKGKRRAEDDPVRSDKRVRKDMVA